MVVFLSIAWALTLLVWVLASTVARQKRAASQIDESLELLRRSLELCEQANDLTEQVVKNQEEMIRLLRHLAGEGHEPAEAAGGFRPSEPIPSLPRN